MSTLAGRMRDLVDRHFDGSVNAAARAIGVPQPTLLRIVDGRTQAPRMGALTRIAQFFRCDEGWLLTGKGRGPGEVEAAGERASAQGPAEAPRVWAARREWESVVESLRLDLTLSRWMRALPLAMQNAVTGLGFYSTETVDGREHRRTWPAVDLALANHYRAWTALVRRALHTIGRAELVRRLEAHGDMVWLGFSAVPYLIYRNGGLPEDWIAEAWAVTDGEIVQDVPAVPAKPSPRGARQPSARRRKR